MPCVRMRPFRLILAVVAITLSTVTVQRPAAQANSDWRAYAGTNASTRYSPLDQINRDTVKTLRIAWRQSVTPPEVRTRLGGGPPPNSSQNTPLKIGNLIYISTGIGATAALDAATGKLVWFDLVPETSDKRRKTLGGAARGVAYWTEGRDERIFAITGDYLVALNAKTGARISTFGQEGTVDLADHYSREAETYAGRSAPVIVRNVIVVGGMGGPMGDAYTENMVSRKEGWPADILADPPRDVRRRLPHHVQCGRKTIPRRRDGCRLVVRPDVPATRSGNPASAGRPRAVRVRAA